MKEQYRPMEPIKKGIQITRIISKSIYEPLKPLVERRMRKQTGEFLSRLFQ